MRKLLFSLLVAISLVGCESAINNEDEVKPVELPKVQRLSKVYKVDFLVHSGNGGTVNVKAPSGLVSDNYASNDTTGGENFLLDFEYSFESDLVNTVWMDCSKLIPRSTERYYVASISVDGVVVASDSIWGRDGFGWGTHLEYVIEK